MGMNGLIFVAIFGVIAIAFTNAGSGCGCTTDILGIHGCTINPQEPPPPGYKCKCMFGNTRPASCFGELEACSSPNDHGCSGCSEKECCSDAEPKGNCDGYMG